jgi:hypothetical protein
MISPEWTGTAVSLHLNVSGKCDSLWFARSQIRSFTEDVRVPSPSVGEGESYRNLLDADKFERWGGLIVFQAKLNDFSHSFHESVEILGLRVATSQGRDGGNEVVLFVSLNNNGEFPRGLHEPILARPNRSQYRCGRKDLRMPLRHRQLNRNLLHNLNIKPF